MTRQVEAVTGFASAGDFVANRCCTAMAIAAGSNVRNADVFTVFGICRVVTGGAFAIGMLIMGESVFRQPMRSDVYGCDLPGRG